MHFYAPYGWVAVATYVCVPANGVKLSVAMPAEFVVAVPTVVAPSLKVTVMPAVASLTVEVNVHVWPSITVVGDSVRLIAAWIVTVPVTLLLVIM